MSEKEDLQDMVLGILAPEEEETKEDFSLEELMNQNRSENEVLAQARKTVENLSSRVDKDHVLALVSDLSAIINRTSATGRYGAANSGYILALNLLEYMRGRLSLDDIVSWIIRYADELELRLLTRDTRRRIAYLEEYWGNETSAHLAEILNTKKPTVERWLDGNNPSSRNAEGMNNIVTVLFRLNKRAEFTRQEALDWFNSHNGNLGDSPRNIIKNSNRWGMNRDLQQELRRIGAFA
jgi:hypothetical protein